MIKKHTSPLDIYGDSVTFDEFWKSISGKFNTSMIKGNKDKRILIPKNSIKSPNKNSENKLKKRKNKTRGPESWRIEKYIKNAEKFNYPGSSLSINDRDSVQFATIDNKKVKLFKKSKNVSITNVSKKIKQRKDTESIKSGKQVMHLRF